MTTKQVSRSRYWIRHHIKYFFLQKLKLSILCKKPDLLIFFLLKIFEFYFCPGNYASHVNGCKVLSIQNSTKSSLKMVTILSYVGNHTDIFFQILFKIQWMDYITDIPIILRHVFNELLSMNSLDLWQRIRFIFLLMFGLFYTFLPVDLIPEAVFGLFGFIDDFLVFFMILVYVCTFFRAIISRNR